VGDCIDVRATPADPLSLSGWRPCINALVVGSANCRLAAQVTAGAVDVVLPELPRRRDQLSQPRAPPSPVGVPQRKLIPA